MTKVAVIGDNCSGSRYCDASSHCPDKAFRFRGKWVISPLICKANEGCDKCVVHCCCNAISIEEKGEEIQFIPVKETEKDKLFNETVKKNEEVFRRKEEGDNRRNPGKDWSNKTYKPTSQPLKTTLPSGRSTIKKNEEAYRRAKEERSNCIICKQVKPFETNEPGWENVCMGCQEKIRLGFPDIRERTLLTWEQLSQKHFRTSMEEMLYLSVKHFSKWRIGQGHQRMTEENIYQQLMAETFLNIYNLKKVTIGGKPCEEYDPNIDQPPGIYYVYSLMGGKDKITFVNEVGTVIPMNPFVMEHYMNKGEGVNEDGTVDIKMTEVISVPKEEA